ncbi:MAG: hypothetical protein WD534_12655 [Phycisphaeraceae bacterium]
MTAVAEKSETTHRVGKFEFTIVADEGGDEDVQQQRSQRRRAITAWLLAEWQREQRRRMAERN